MALSKKRTQSELGLCFALPNRASKYLHRATPWENLSLNSKSFLPLGPRKLGRLRAPAHSLFSRSFSSQGDSSGGQAHS